MRTKPLGQTTLSTTQVVQGLHSQIRSSYQLAGNTIDIEDI